MIAGMIASTSTGHFSEAGEANYRKAILERATLLAEDEDKTAGFLIGSIQKPAPGAARYVVAAQLNNIFIREGWRGRQIGQQLAEEFKRICKAEQVEQLNVTVNSRNEDAIAFYKHIGLAPSRMFMSMKL